jgi:hypothetical protein
MSLEARLRYQYNNLLSLADALSLPQWMFSLPARLVMLALIVVFSVGYVFQISALSTSGYVIHGLEKKVALVSSETQKLSTEVASYQSMASIQKRLNELSMRSASTITFVKASPRTSVAER